MSERRTVRRLAATLLIGLSSLMPGCAHAADGPPDFAERAAALVEPYLESSLFSGTVVVAKAGNPVFRRAYGLANREWGVANTLDTRFRIGSISKTFTAAAILRLAEQGRLALDDRIRGLVPSAPPAWDRVTLRDLLHHSSGIINFTALPDYYARISRIERSPQEIIALTENEPLLFEPGARVEYSNTNYVLLGMAIEAISGLPYARYIRDTFLGPLGLKDTDEDDASVIVPRRASGYRFGQAHWRNAAPMASGVTFAAGGLHASADDLVAWNEALFGGRTISAGSLAAMTDDKGQGYGLGLYVGRANGSRLWSHGGALFGFLSIDDYYPDERLSVIVLANNENAPVQKIARELGALWFGIIDPPDPVTVEDFILERYAGTYQIGPRFFLTVRRDGNRLVAHGTGQPAFSFLPESDRTFFSKVVDARITFDTQPDGRADGLILHQAGLDRIGPRVDPLTAERILAEPPAVHAETAIDRSRLPGFAGRYTLGPSMMLEVSVEDDRLFVQATGQPRGELFPEGERRFFLKTIDAQITFEIDAGGRTTGLVLHQGGLDTPADRVEGDQAATRTSPGR